MEQAIGFLAFTSAVQVAAFGVAVLAILGRDAPPAATRYVGAAAACVVLITVGLFFPFLGFDFRIFWGVGREVLAGRNPYAPGGRFDPAFVNPPTALPLFALLAALPRPVSFGAFTALNVAGAAALPAYGRAILKAQGLAGPRGPVAWDLPGAAVAALAVALVVSESVSIGVFIGQLGLVEALLLLAALDAQARGRPTLAGLALAAATVKVATMLPFLLLFLRRPDLRTWVALSGACALMIAATGHATTLPGDLAAMLGRIARMAAPGRVNDFSFANEHHVSLIGLDYALSCLGLADRRAARLGQASGLLLLGAALARVVVRERVPRAGAVALVSLYSCLFLYHRGYDAMILAPALVYAAGRARAERGRPRVAFAAAAVAVLFVLYLRPASMTALAWTLPRGPLWGRLARAAILPLATWLILLAMALLAWGDARARAADPGPDPA